MKLAKPLLLSADRSFCLETLLFLLLGLFYSLLLLLQVMNLANAEGVEADPLVLEAGMVEGFLVTGLGIPIG